MIEDEQPALALPAAHTGLYVHIPFCVRKCRYCDFASQPVTGTREQEEYLNALATEGALRRALMTRPLHSIYIGGGTPTVLGGDGLRQLWDEVIAPFARTPDAEITLEANPATLTSEVLQAITDLPFTRVSLGVQSMQVEELKKLGRIHSPQDVLDGVTSLREAGVRQLNLDLMYGIPDQTLASWDDTLGHLRTLQPEHISLYSLMIEEGTPFADEHAAGTLSLPDEIEEEQMNRLAHTRLAEMGYVSYEVSNAARAGCHSRHNLGYWLGRDYLGLGSAATSTVTGLRWRNTAVVSDYIHRLAAGLPVIDYLERLASQHRLLERVMLGLRLRGGFDLTEAEEECACRLADIAPRALADLQQQRLLEVDGRVLRLPSQGFHSANDVVARLMADYQCRHSEYEGEK